MNETIIIFVVFSVISFTLLASAICTFRAQRFWGTWLMLVTSLVAVPSALAMGIASYFLMKTLTSYSFTTGSYEYEFYEQISQISSYIWIGSLLLFCVGLLGLASRFSVTVKRAAELETLTKSLADHHSKSS